MAKDHVLYKCWWSMINRCVNPGSTAYHNYGGRGIKVCKRWMVSFDDFSADMGPRPSAKHSIDRIDNDGDYCPENCRWATCKTQRSNSRQNRYLTAFGRTQILADWSREFGVKSTTIRERLEDGWTIEDAITKAPMQLRGDEKPNALLTDEQVRFIRRSCKKRGDCSRIAEQFGVSRFVVSSALRGVSYSHVK